MELFVLYLWLKLNFISLSFVLVGLITIFICFCILMNSTDYYTKEAKAEYWIKWKPKFKKLLYLVVFCFVVAGMLPSKSDVALLVGTHYVLKASDTPEAHKVGTLLRQKANDMLDEQINKEKK